MLTSLLPTFFQSDALLASSEREQLRAEAAQLRNSARRNARETFTIVDGDRLLGSVRNWVQATGEVRQSLQPLLADRLSELLHGRVQPMASCYLYYDRDDFIALHTDQATWAVNILVWLDGPAGSLHIHPELQAQGAEQLLQVATTHAGHPPGGQRVDLRDGALVLTGHAIPHHRPPHASDQELVLATFGFVPA